MPNGFLGGIETGRKLGGRNVFNTLLESVNTAEKRKREKDAKESERLQKLRDSILLEGTKAKIQEMIEKTQAEAKAKRGSEEKRRQEKAGLKKSVLLERIKGGEKRRTEEVKAREKERPLTISDLSLPAKGPSGAPVVRGPRGIPITGTEGEAIGGEVSQADVLRTMGLRPKGVIGEELTGEFPKETKADKFKPFQLTPEREQEFKVSIQNGLNALQRGEENPATGQPYTAQEIFRTLSAAFPGQVNRLRTMFLSGVKAGETEDFGDILFGEE